jgi:hypothetical protein
MDPDPAIFVSDLQDVNQKNFIVFFFCLLLLEVHYIIFQRKSHKKS